MTFQTGEVEGAREVWGSVFYQDYSTPPETKEWRAPKMMGFGNGDSGFRYGPFLVSGC